MSETSNTTTLYALNKGLIYRLPDYDDVAWQGAEKTLTDFINKYSQFNYFMMYGKELGYFTLFHRVEHNIEDSFAKIVKECLDNVGVVRALSLTDEEDAIEIWAYNEISGDVIYLKLFPYDDGVVDFEK